MRARQALAWYFGLGAGGYAGWQLFRAGAAIGPLGFPASEPIAFGFLALFAAFATAALALVTLVPAGFEAERAWVEQTAALLPAIVAAFAVEQLEEALVPGGAEAQLSTTVLIGLATLAAGAWLVTRAEDDQRRWMALGLLPATVLAAVSILTRYGVAQAAALALAAALAVGLGLEWIRPLPVDSPGEAGTSGEPS